MRIALSCLCFLAGCVPAQENLLPHGDIGSGEGWSFAGGGPGVTHSIDGKEGAGGAGSLYIHKEDPTLTSPDNWTHTLEMDALEVSRLELTGKIKAKGMAGGSQACVMVQCWKGGQMVSGAWSDKVTTDGDWRAVSMVWAVPGGTETIRVRAYLVGQGEVWFDDLVVTPTEKEPTEMPPAPPPADDRYQQLARRCAEEIPWWFDLEKAMEESTRTGRPLLLYLRCTDKDEGIPDARQSLPAVEIPFRDDGLRKDILFRAGPLSDPAVAQLIERRFVPVCLTYSFAVLTQGRARTLPAHSDPLEPLGGSCADLGTPALLLARGDRILARLHRLGALSADHVDHWLRQVLRRQGMRFRTDDIGELLASGEPERVLSRTGKATDAPERLHRGAAQLRLGELQEASKTLAEQEGPEAALLRGLVALRRGEWGPALEALEPARGAPGDTGEAARFWSGWALLRRGDAAAAQELWQALVGESRFGKKAAACLLQGGPHLWLSETVRGWPRVKGLPEESEGEDWGAFDPVQSIEALLALQHADGSFISHQARTMPAASPPGAGPVASIDHSQVAYTALAADALHAWSEHVPASVAKRAREARERALTWLEAWSRGTGPPAVFSIPYGCMTLLEAGRLEAAMRVVDRIVATQLPDGAWTVYNPQRTASFNTALCIMALCRARDAGLTIPEGVLEKGVQALEAMRQEGDLFPYSPATGHEWMTTEHGSIARDPLCEDALLLAGRGQKARLGAALQRFLRFHEELRAPTKRYYDFFNMRGHGGYYFFFAHHNAYRAAGHLGKGPRERVRRTVRAAVLAAREADGTFMDQYSQGRSYGTAMALILLAPR